jgi:hypothetical protein
VSLARGGPLQFRFNPSLWLRNNSR